MIVSTGSAKSRCCFSYQRDDEAGTQLRRACIAASWRTYDVRLAVIKTHSCSLVPVVARRATDNDVALVEFLLTWSGDLLRNVSLSHDVKGENTNKKTEICPRLETGTLSNGRPMNHSSRIVGASYLNVILVSTTQGASRPTGLWSTLNSVVTEMPNYKQSI